MLRQQNFQIPKPKRRKLYTPLSDEEENVENEFSSKITYENVDVAKVEKSAQKPIEKAHKDQIALNVKEQDPDEIAENFSWKMLKPTFRSKEAVVGDIWKCCWKFNPIEVANKMAIYKKPENFDDNIDHIMDVLMKNSTNNKRQQNKSQINDYFVNKEKKKEESSHSPKNRLYSVVEIRQLHSSNNDFSIKTIPSAINCDVLSNIFTQHEISRENQKNQTIEQINNPIKDDFIASQFVNSTILNIEDESGYDSMNQKEKKKILIDPNKILEEWIRESRSDKRELIKINDDGEEVVSKTSLLSESSRKIQHSGLLSSCFL